jgi:2,5-diketo-D-gluconate reductase A
MSTSPLMTFNDGRTIPQLGLGVWKTPNDTAASTMQTALDAGYRHIDTAAVYENEDGVGDGLAQASVAREDIFLTTKLWNEAQGFDSTLKAMDESLKRLKTDYVDLYLIHWPSPWREKYVDTWKALVQLQKDGKARSIGVSNFGPEHLERIIGETGVVPALNQIELHPRFQQHAWTKANADHGILTEAWSPLGQGKFLDNPVIGEIAKKHGKSAAQVIIRWHIDGNRIVIPKSVTPSRIVDNIAVFDFALDADDLAKIAALDSADGRLGSDPATASF